MYIYFPQPGQQCTTSCTNTSHSVQKSFLQSGQRYRPSGLKPSVVLVPAAAAVIPVAVPVDVVPVAAPTPAVEMLPVFVFVLEGIRGNGAAQPWQAGEADVPLASVFVLGTITGC